MAVAGRLELNVRGVRRSEAALVRAARGGDSAAVEELFRRHWPGTYRAAYLKDRGVRMTKESAMAKLFASEIAVKAADDCVQIHGGYGFVKDYPAEKYFRDVKLTTIGEGTSEIQRLVIARQLLAS